jgi:hypothetical protein
MKKLNQRYCSEDTEEVESLSQEERGEVERVQKLIKESRENERQRLLANLDEFYYGHEVQLGIKLTVIADFCWLCPEDEAFGIYGSQAKEIPDNERDEKLEKYRVEMNAFTQFMKEKYFA